MTQASDVTALPRLEGILVLPARSGADDPAIVQATAVAAATGAGIDILDASIGSQRTEDAVSAVLARVREHGHDLIIKTARPPDRRRVFGSVATQLMRRASCPVWVVPDRPEVPGRPVLAAIDVDQPSGIADVLALARTIADAKEVDLHIVYAWSMFGEGWLNHPNGSPEHLPRILAAERRRRAGQLSALLKQHAAVVEGARVHLIKGAPHSVIAQLARELIADAIVTGTAGREGLAGLVMGNTAERLLQVGAPGVVTIRDERAGE